MTLHSVDCYCCHYVLYWAITSLCSCINQHLIFGFKCKTRMQKTAVLSVIKCSQVETIFRVGPSDMTIVYVQKNFDALAGCLLYLLEECLLYGLLALKLLCSLFVVSILQCRNLMCHCALACKKLSYTAHFLAKCCNKVCYIV